jgi:hypothetical protein
MHSYFFDPYTGKLLLDITLCGVEASQIQPIIGKLPEKVQFGKDVVYVFSIKQVHSVLHP